MSLPEGERVNSQYVRARIIPLASSLPPRSKRSPPSRIARPRPPPHPLPPLSPPPPLSIPSPPTPYSPPSSPPTSTPPASPPRHSAPAPPPPSRSPSRAPSDPSRPTSALTTGPTPSSFLTSRGLLASAARLLGLCRRLRDLVAGWPADRLDLAKAAEMHREMELLYQEGNLAGISVVEDEIR
ncbi:hypothetical protein C4D60_Mb09t15880 [Musa balbisiana]|uniref:Uncharacterized protein n=1 Tax=Musa balbisiana TaxID=52838 RepID=A0A4S8IGU1_MUSBA|nr:hypothetical protein C4D60_Mb09t15880 [Musa balbisiana]